MSAVRTKLPPDLDRALLPTDTRKALREVPHVPFASRFAGMEYETPLNVNAVAMIHLLNKTS